jgi:NADH-quinone oxidoreductase subunit N
VPKIAGLVALVRIVSLAMPGVESIGWRLALIVAIATMTLGNTLALWQENVRRLLAYSAIAHAGYLLIGLAAAFAAGGVERGLAADGAHALLLYLAVYSLATIGAFAVLDYVSTTTRPLNSVDELAGLGRTQPLAAVAMSVFMFSLAGIPPLAGFWGKLALFRSAIAAAQGPGLDTWFIALAVIGGLNAAVAAAYYLRIVGTMYFRSPIATLPTEGRGAWTALCACALLVLAVGISPKLLVSGAYAAARSAQRQVLPAVQETVASSPGGTGEYAATPR